MSEVVDEVCTDWLRVTPDHPRPGAKVFIWHPRYGVIHAYRDREVGSSGIGECSLSGDGFYQAHLGIITLIDFPVVWWMPEPGRPPGEVNPADYMGPRHQFNQIGFVPPGGK